MRSRLLAGLSAARTVPAGGLVAALLAGSALLWVACAGVDFTAPTGSMMEIDANPLTIALSGGESTISVRMFDGMSGIPVPDGTVIRFTTTLGAVDPRAETKNGLADVALRSTGLSGMAEVTAFSGSVSTSVMITIGVAATNISLTATPADLGVDGGTADLTATVFGDNAAPLAGATVVFATDAGSLASGGNPVTTGADGVARDTLSTTRTAQVTATVGGQSDTTTVTVDDPGVVVSVVLSADKTDINPGETVQLVAVVFGDNGPVAEVPVAWTATAGELGTAGSTITDMDGEARNSLTTSADATVTAVAGGQMGSIDINVAGAATVARVVINSPNVAITPQAPPPAATPLCDETMPVPPNNDLPIQVTARVEADDGSGLDGFEVSFTFDAPSGCERQFGFFCDTAGVTASATSSGGGFATVYFSMDDADFDFCNCLPVGTCPLCPTSPTCGQACGTGEAFCSVVIKAFAAGVESDNTLTIGYQ